MRVDGVSPDHLLQEIQGLVRLPEFLVMSGEVEPAFANPAIRVFTDVFQDLFLEDLVLLAGRKAGAVATLARCRASRAGPGKTSQAARSRKTGKSVDWFGTRIDDEGNA